MALRRALWVISISILSLFGTNFAAQWNKKPISEWSQTDARRAFDDSPWVRTQTVTVDRGSPVKNSEPGREVDFYIRIISAKPMIEALKRSKLTPEREPALAEWLKNLIASGRGDHVIVAIGRNRNSLVDWIFR